MFFAEFGPALDDDVIREQQRRAVEKWFRKEATDASDVSSSIEQVGESYRLASLVTFGAFKEAVVGGSLPTAQVVRVVATVVSRPVEMIVSIGQGRLSAHITTINWYTRLQKSIPCDARVEKKGFGRSRFVGANAAWCDQVNQDSLLCRELRKAMRDSYKSAGYRVTVRAAFGMKPEPEGLQIWLRSCPKSVWWTRGLFVELGVRDFVKLIDRIDRSLPS